MQFNQASSTVPNLYYSDANPVSSPPSSITPQVWFLLPLTGNLPTKISVADSWNIYTSGVYIFLDEALDQTKEFSFARAVQRYFRDLNLTSARFAWFSNPNQGNASKPQGGLIGNSISIGRHNWTSQQARFNFQNISLTFVTGCPVTLNTDDSFNISLAASKSPIFVSPDGGQTMLPVTQPVRLPLSGELSGCLQFPLQIGQTEGVSDLALLDVGLRYFYPTPKNGTGAGDNVTELTSLRYPVFDESPPPTVTVYGNLDPLSTDDSRTYFAFNASDAGLPPVASSPLVSNYVSTLGHQFSLVPLDAASAPTAFARLAFVQNPSALPPGPQDPFYLVPKGDFQIQLPAASPAVGGSSLPELRLMCGLSGVEYIALEGGATNYLSFFDGNAAYTSGFVPSNPAGGSSFGSVGNGPTTSWAFISSTSPLTYYAQPDQAVLYQPQAASPPSEFQPLFYLEVPSNQLPAAPTSASSFPMMPYAGVTPDMSSPPTDVLSIFQQLETQVLSPLRRNIVINISKKNITARMEAALDSAPIYGTTPQGLLAQFAQGYTEWAELVFAQMAGGQRFMLTGIENGSDLWNALQTNQLFLVISDPNAIKAYLQSANAEISMGNPSWNFNFDPSLWSQIGLAQTKGTIMILKFLNKRIVDLAADTTTWVQADKFNQSPLATSFILGKIISQALDQYKKGDSNFQYFSQVVTDPNWNGILMLNGEAPLSEIPPQLAGLAAGIDPALFFAHHIGINASVIDQTTSPISLQNSTIFGLINYQDESPLASGGQDYRFRVSSLKVLFANSQVSSFSSEIELMINSIFGEPVALQKNASANIVDMFGVFQQQVLPDGTTEQSYFFQTAEGTNTVLNMQSHVLNAVQIDKGQFITETSNSNATGSPPSETDTRFVFWGLIDFVNLMSVESSKIEGIDLFSFGREAGANSPAGLSFANLAIDMSFQSNDPSEQTFTFDASQLSFDMAGSYARKNSLFSNFPLTLISLTQAKSGATPTGQGFMGVQSPLSQSALQYPWYSLNFNLNLGTVGALAGEVGFVASFIAAWSPNVSEYSVFTGLSLPGSNGGKREISIEGVLKITFKTIELLADNSSGNLAYILVFYTIALSFLSKSFPPTGQVNIVLFGDPDPQGDNTSLGWYAAYAKPQSNTKKPSQPAIPATTREV